MDATYISTNSFSVAGDRTSEFIEHRRVKCDCGTDGIKYANIVSSVYSAPNTNVVINESELTSNLVTVKYGVVQPGPSGSLPDHDHSDEEGTGGLVGFTSLSGTPSAYTPNLFLKSNADGSGLEFSLVTASGVVLPFLQLTDTPSTYSGTEDMHLVSTGSGIAFTYDGVWFRGTGAPSNSIGDTGSFYFEEDVSDIYKKINIYDYCVWSDTDKSTWITVSSDGLTATSTANSYGGVRAITEIQTGKWYWEVTLDGNVANTSMGVGNASAALNQFIGNNTDSWGIYQTGDLYYNSSTHSSGLGTLSDEDVIGFALDVNGSDKKMWISKNGTWMGNPVTGSGSAFDSDIYPVSGALYPMGNPYAASSSQIINCETFVYTTPSGFSFLYDSYVVEWRKKIDHTFVELDDVPSTYSGTSGAHVKSTGSALEFTYDGIWFSGDDTPLGTIGSTGSFYFKDSNNSIYLDRNVYDYCVWSDTDKHTWITVSSDGLTATSTANSYGGVRAITGISSGKWYWEVTLDGNIANTSMGVGNISAALTQFIGDNTDSWGIYQTGDLYYSGSSHSSGLGAIVDGDVIGFALDLDSTNKKMWVSKNGTWMGNPVTGSGSAFDMDTYLIEGSLYPMGNPYAASSSQIINCGDDFSYSIPTGYGFLYDSYVVEWFNQGHLVPTYSGSGKFLKTTTSGLEWGEGGSTIISLTDTPSGYDDGKYLRSTAAGTEWATVSGVLALLELTDTPATYDDGKYLRSTVSGTEWATISGGGGASTLLELTDTPAAYDSGKYLKSTASGAEWATISGGAGDMWLSGIGTPSGTLGDETNFYYDIDTIDVYRKENVYAYCVWSTTDKHANVTVSADQLVATSAATGYTSLRAITGVSSGKWYWEVTAEGTLTNSSVGVGNASALLSNYVGQNTNSWGLYSNASLYYDAGAHVSGLGTFATKDVFGIALDLDSANKKMWVSKNGVWMGDPEAGTGEAFDTTTYNLDGTLYPMGSPYTNESTQAINCGAVVKYTVPEGFNLLYDSYAAEWNKKVDRTFTELSDTLTTYSGVDEAHLIIKNSGVQASYEGVWYNSVNMPDSSVGGGDSFYLYDDSDLYRKKPDNLYLNENDKHADIDLYYNNTIAIKFGSNGYISVRSNNSVSSGKTYWEYKIIGNVTPSNCCVGVGNSSALLNNYVGQNTNSWGLLQSGNLYYDGGWHSSGLGTFAIGDIIGIAINLDYRFNKKMWVSKNGVWMGDPEAGTGEAFDYDDYDFEGTLYPMLTLYSNEQSIQLLLTSDDIVYDIPSGFDLIAPPTSSWDRIGMIVPETSMERAYLRSTTLSGIEYSQEGLWYEGESTPSGIDVMQDSYYLCDDSSVYKNKSDIYGCVWNENDKDSSILVVENGTLMRGTATNSYRSVRATQSVSSGKWYWEYTVSNVASNCMMGIGNSSALLTHYVGQNANSWGLYQNGNLYYNAGTHSSGLGSLSVDDVIGIAINLDHPYNKKMWVSKNGVWMGDPEAGTGAAFDTLDYSFDGTLFPMGTSYAVDAQLWINANSHDTGLISRTPVGFNTGVHAYEWRRRGFLVPDIDTDLTGAHVVVTSSSGIAFGFDNVWFSGDDVPASGTAGGIGSYYLRETNNLVYEKEDYGIFTNSRFDSGFIGTNCALSNDDLTFTVTATNHRSVRSLTAVSTGKWYWEVTVDDGSVNYYIGVVNSTHLNTEWLGGYDSGWCYHANGQVYHSGGASAYGNTYTTGDVIGIALDLGDGDDFIKRVWFSKNGVWQNSGDPVAGINEAFNFEDDDFNGPLYPAISLYTSGDIGTINLGEVSLNYTPPDGFNVGVYAPATRWVEVGYLAPTYSGSGQVLKTTLSGLEWGAEGGGASTLLELTDTPVAYDDGKYLKSTVAGTEWATVSGGGGGSSTFVGLTDAPSSYSGQANKFPMVNSAETGLEFTTVSGLVLYGTGDPPSPTGYADGTVYYKYTA